MNKPSKLPDNSKIKTLKKQLKNASGTDEINILNQLAGEYFNQSATTALEYSGKALTLAREICYRQGEAVALRGIGNICYRHGDYAEALRNYQESLVIEKELNNVSSVAGVLSNIGMIHALTGAFEKAIEVNIEAMKLLEGIDNKENIVRIILNNLGNCYLELKDYNNSLNFYKRSLSMSRKLDDQQGVAFSLSNIAIVFHKRGKFDEAVKYFQKALDIRKELKNSYGLATTILNMGSCIMESGDTSHAKEYIEKGLQIAEKENFKELIKNGLGAISTILLREGNYKEAFDFHKRFSDLSEILYNEENSRIIAKMQARFDLKQKIIEIESLKEAKDILESKVQKRTVELTRKNEKLEHEITVRKKAEEERKRLNTELIMKNKELEQMIFVASHDLRSPLVNIKGFSSELELSIKELIAKLKDESTTNRVKEKIAPLLEEDIPEALQFILKSIAKMDTLLSGLLKLSRVGRAELTIVKIDMNKLISDVINTRAFQIKDLDVKLDVGNLPPCKGDRKLIDQLFSNLLDNALKYLDPNRSGIIKISGYREKNKSIYFIEDNGIGIAQEHQKKIFEIFHQLNPETSSGEGLGLNIANRIIEKHLGKIWVESEYGKGCKFYVAIPMK